MIEISKSFRFEAAHSLPHLPVEHKCHNVHGHSYEVVVHVAGRLDNKEWVIDYADISAAVLPLIAARFDHKNLNETMDFPTTAENLAIEIYISLKKALNVSAIEVRETPTTNVIYRP